MILLGLYVRITGPNAISYYGFIKHQICRFLKILLLQLRSPEVFLLLILNLLEVKNTLCLEIQLFSGLIVVAYRSVIPAGRPPLMGQMGALFLVTNRDFIT